MKTKTSKACIKKNIVDYFIDKEKELSYAEFIL